jgi:hypothetical protein
MVSQPGDSGSSVTWDTTVFGTAGIGITSGTSAGYLVYGHLAYVLTSWGLLMDGN